MSKCSNLLTCQQVLNILVFTGFMLHHCLRANISIALVEMIDRNSTANSTSNSPRFKWNEKQKSDILGYFFWGYILTQIPGGRLSEKYGAKIVMGTSLLTTSILTLLTHFVTIHLGHFWLVLNRFFMGIALGLQWPSVPPIATKWVPPENRSTFFSHMVASSLGVAFILPICGYLLAYSGWPSVFYLTGGLTFIWSLCWFYFVYNTPQEHPRISQEEKERLSRKIPIVKIQKKLPTPWVKMITSGAVWAIMIGNYCGSTTFFVVLNELPTYMSLVLKYNIKENGWFSSLPYLARYFSALGSSLLADRVIKSKKFSVQNIRKFLTATCFFGTCGLFLIQANWGYSRVISTLVFTLSFALMGLITPGVYSNPTDISPVYAGTILGFSQVPCAITGFVTTKLVAFFTSEKQDFEHWKYVFWMLVAVNLFCGIFILIFMKGEEQSWSIASRQEEQKMLELNKNDDFEKNNKQIN